MGIVNGTTNYILTRMTEEGASFDDALAEAQALGYAEADPTADVEGFDAAAKAAIIASIAFGARVVAGDVYREGITEITADDIASARDLGYVVKLLAVAEELDGEVAVRVHPAMVPVHHPLAVGARLVQRGVHRGRRGRRAHALRPGRRRRPDRVGGARRPRRRGEEPGRGGAGATIGDARREADPRRSTSVESQFYLLHGGGRPPGRARARSPASSGARRVDQVDGAARAWATTPASSSSPTAPGGRPARHARRAARRRAGAPGRLGPAGRSGKRNERGRRRWPGSSRPTASTCPVTDATPVITLLEGNTPLLDAPRIAAAGRRRPGRASRSKGPTPPARSRTGA